MDIGSINLQSMLLAVVLGVVLARMLMRIGTTRAELRRLERKVDAIAVDLAEAKAAVEAIQRKRGS